MNILFPVFAGIAALVALGLLYWRHRVKRELAVMAGFLALFIVAQAGIVLEITSWTLAFWVPFGMSGQVAVLAYPWLSARFGTALSGRANTAMNLLLFLAAYVGPYLTQWQLSRNDGCADKTVDVAPPVSYARYLADGF